MRKNLFMLSQEEIPVQWYNIASDLPGGLPKDHDIEGVESRIEHMKMIRPKELTKQDQSIERYVDIPSEVLEKYLRVGRPTPLMRAYELEKYLETPSHIYIKREDYMPTQSFKINSAIAQTYYIKKQGYKGVVSETGAGQWGLALSYAAVMEKLALNFFWVKVSREQKPMRADWCKLFGANIFDSPSQITETGRKMLARDANCPGALGIAIGEAVEYCLSNPEYAYASGSNLVHVIMHQTIIGQEVKKQMKMIGEKADVLVACCGGGSNLGGFIGPFIFDEDYKAKTKFLAVESDAAPRLTKGEYKYDSADPYGFTPLAKSYTLGRDFIPAPNHVGGLRQHNGSPVVGKLRHDGYLDAVACSQEQALKAGLLFSQLYGMLPAPESSHALWGAIQLALEAKKTNEKKNILICLSGNGVLDMSAYKTLM